MPSATVVSLCAVRAAVPPTGVPSDAVAGQAPSLPRRTAVCATSAPWGSVQDRSTCPAVDASAARPLTGSGGCKPSVVPPLEEPPESPFPPEPPAPCATPELDCFDAGGCDRSCFADPPPVGSAVVACATVRTALASVPRSSGRMGVYCWCGHQTSASTAAMATAVIARKFSLNFC